MATILNHLQLKSGAVVKNDRKGISLTQPSQFLPKGDKDDEWYEQNIDYLEREGLKKVQRNGRRLMRNLRMAKGVIDKGDYIPNMNEDYSNMVESLLKDGSASELKYYPIVPNVVRFLKTKFGERVPQLRFEAQDDFSRNEKLTQKKDKIEQVLLAQEQQKLFQKLIEAGMDPDSDEFKQQVSPDNIKTLPEVEEYFKKDYRSTILDWANAQRHVDERRFSLPELEVEAFEQSLWAGREFWHFKMLEDDYEVELWNPIYTAFKKSPTKKYISGGQSVINFQKLTVADVIDTYGYLMDEDQLESLERIKPGYDGMYDITGTLNDGSMYNPTKNYKWNTEGPSVGMRQFNAVMAPWLQGVDLTSWMTDGVDDFMNFGREDLLLVSTCYWKTQRKLFHLTKITVEGELISQVVTEDYKVTDKPQYNTILFKEKTADNLIFGEHLEALYVNQVLGAVKIGRNLPTTYSGGSYLDNEPIYLGIDRGKPGPLKFQFKGDYSLYGCKLPVEGRVFSDDDEKSAAPVDLMRPGQIGFNLVCNQIIDIVTDEVGPAAIIDQNFLPKYSLGEDWGPNNFEKAYESIRRFGILPIDSSNRNTAGATNFNQWGTVMDLSQTNRLKSRMELALYFKQQTLSIFGLSDESIGQVTASQTATGTQQAVQGSIAQIETFFTQHSDWLMPRVHQMRTDLAQYYHSTKPSIQLQFVTQLGDEINFHMNTTNLLARDIHVYATTDVNSRNILYQMRRMFLENNTTGASMSDLGNVLKSESVAEMDNIMKESEAKASAIRQQEQQHENDLQQQQIEAEQAKDQAERNFKSSESALDREARIKEELIRSSGMNTGDSDKDGQDDYLERLKYLNDNTQFGQKLDFERQKHEDQMTSEQEQLQVKREDIRQRAKTSRDEVQVAITNKNYMDKKVAQKPKKKSS